MFRDRPLTWLFVIATVCVDLALMVSGSDADFPAPAILGFLLGQIAVTAIWTVRGHIHRLLRASCFVLSTGFLTRVCHSEPPLMGALFIYASAIYAVALASHVYFIRQDGENRSSASKRQFQVPLIEFFGLTIVVAIAAYMARSVPFAELWEGLSLVEWGVILVVPGLFATWTRNDLRDLGIRKALLIIVTAFAAGWYLSNSLVVVQMTYVGAWMAVLDFDNVISEAITLRSTSSDDAKASTKPKLFNPQD